MLRRLVNPPWAGAAVGFLGLALWWFCLPHTRGAAPWIYSWDSAAYIETADSLRAGRGLYQRVYEGVGREIWMPMSWWPPGYSVLTAVGTLFGLPAKDACLVVSGVNGALAVIALGLIGVRLFHWSVALPLTAAVAASVAFQKVSVQCMSDTSYFIFVLASAGCLIFWTTAAKGSMRWLFAAGLFAGAAWATRNTGLALFAASGLFLAVLLVRLPPRRVVALSVTWFAGVAACAAPLIIHNLIVFGRLSGYEMPPSDLSLIHNVRRATWVVVSDMTTSMFIAGHAWARVLAFVVMVAVILGLAAAIQFRLGMTRAQLAQAFYDKRIQVLLLAYAGAYSAIVILARTKYRWGEEIDPRHMFQVYWALWICIALWLRDLLEQFDPKPARRAALLTAAFVVVSSLQIASLVRYTAAPAHRVETMEARIGAKACEYLRRNVGPNAIVLSSRAAILRVDCDVNARKIAPVDQYYKLQALSREDIYREAQDGFLWGVVIEDVEDARKGGLGPIFKDMALRPDDQPGFRRIFRDGPAVILEWHGR